jgi:hypothetical protein
VGRMDCHNIDTCQNMMIIFDSADVGITRWCDWCGHEISAGDPMIIWGVSSTKYLKILHPTCSKDAEDWEWDWKPEKHEQ